MGTLPDTFSRNPNAPRIPLHPRGSFDSDVSAITTSGDSGSVYYPRRVESIMGEEDRRKYHFAQATQKEAGGAYLTNEPYDPAAIIYGSGPNQPVPSRSHESVASASNSIHHYRSGSLTPPHILSHGGTVGPSSAPPSPPSMSLSGSQTNLAHPEPAFRSNGGRASYSSPLARMSVARSSVTDSSEGGPMELNPTVPEPEATGPSSSQHEDNTSSRRHNKGRKLTKKKR